jgi:hypothetical protein
LIDFSLAARIASLLFVVLAEMGDIMHTNPKKGL